MENFTKVINKIGPTKVSNIVGCPLNTAKKWSAGKTIPAPYFQALIINKINTSLIHARVREESEVSNENI